MKSRLILIAASSTLLLSATADAHIGLISPESRYGRNVLKKGPCGMTGGVRTTDKVATYKPGETIEIVWDEYVNHPGHYRISFDDDGDDDFVDPASFEELNSAPSVLVDGIADGQGGMFTYSLTLPDVECDNCTLQVIQVMTDKPPYGDGNDIYYQCIDLVLTNAPQDPMDPTDPPVDPMDPMDPMDQMDPTDPGTGEVTGACNAGGSGSDAPAGLAFLAFASLISLRRRRD